jgi:RNA polymerase sigma factor (sigma-70 family)
VGDNEKLLAAAAQGDQAAWEVLVQRHNGLLWSVARGFRLDGADAGDAIQTTWLRLVENLERIKDPERLASWLATTLRHECLRLLRRGKREQPTGGSEEPNAVPGAADPLDAGLLTEERDAALWAALCRVGEQCQRLLRVLTASPPLSDAEVSELLEVPIDSIGSARARCLDQLRGDVAGK